MNELQRASSCISLYGWSNAAERSIVINNWHKLNLLIVWFDQRNSRSSRWISLEKCWNAIKMGIHRVWRARVDCWINWCSCDFRTSCDQIGAPRISNLSDKFEFTLCNLKNVWFSRDKKYLWVDVITKVLVNFHHKQILFQGGLVRPLAGTICLPP